MDVRVGDHILTKKPHPCGASEFAVLRVGMDFRIRCVKCGREVMVARSKIEKNIKKIVREALPLSQGFFLSVQRVLCTEIFQINQEGSFAHDGKTARCARAI